MSENKSNKPKSSVPKKTTSISKPKSAVSKKTANVVRSKTKIIEPSDHARISKIQAKLESSENTKTSKISRTTYDVLVSNISALFLSDKTVMLIKHDETFQEVIGDYLNAIYTFEEQTDFKEPQIDNFLVAYKTVVGKPYDPVIITNEKIDDLDDKISYLNIFIRNTLNTEWSEILESFKKDTKKIDADAIVGIATVVGTVNAANSNINNNTTSSQGQQQSRNSQGTFNSEEFLKNNNVNFDQMAENTIASYARVLLYTKVLKNDYFVFDSKPSFFVWIKWLYLFGIILFSLTLLATFILQTIPMNSIFLFNTAIPSGGPSLEQSNWFLANSNLSWTSFMGTNSVSIIFLVFIILSISWNISSTGWKEIKFLNNDNYRFSCSFMPIFFLVTGLIILSLYPLFTNQAIHPLTWLQKVLANPISENRNITLFFNSGNTKEMSINNAASYNSMLALSVLHISLLSFGGLAIITSIGIKLIAPKKNFEFINLTLSQIADDIRNNRVDLSAIQNQMSGTRMRLTEMRRFI